MVNLQEGMVVHAKKVDLHSGGNTYGYSAPRGKKFVVLVLGCEDPNTADRISANAFLRANGWSHESDVKKA